MKFKDLQGFSDNFRLPVDRGLSYLGKVIPKKFKLPSFKPKISLFSKLKSFIPKIASPLLSLGSLRKAVFIGGAAFGIYSYFKYRSFFSKPSVTVALPQPQPQPKVESNRDSFDNPYSFRDRYFSGYRPNFSYRRRKTYNSYRRYGRY